MNPLVKAFTAVAASLLSACSTQPAQRQNTPMEAVANPPPQENQPDNYDAANNPPLTTKKNGKTLNLVRIMDGGTCKNELQGVSGSFLLYADPHDIERIRREKPKEIFKDFEEKIQHFTSEILGLAADQTNLSIDPFSLGDDVTQQNLAVQLTKNFRNAALRPLATFTHETTLTIDVMPFSPSLVFYQKGCDASRFQP